MPYMNYWLLKSEPETYSIRNLKHDKTTSWTGVRNFQARNHLRLMEVGDKCLFYHSGKDKAVVGLARVVKSAYPDTTASEGDWNAADIAFDEVLKNPVPLSAIKADPALKSMQLVTHSRLSVQKVTKEEFEHVLNLSKK